jgi:hypothetical protein
MGPVFLKPVDDEEAPTADTPPALSTDELEGECVIHSKRLPQRCRPKRQLNVNPTSGQLANCRTMLEDVLHENELIRTENRKLQEQGRQEGSGGLELSGMGLLTN